MLGNDTLEARTVLLLGLGHTHAHVLKAWRMRPRAGARLVCVSDAPTAAYSGMLPGTLAGQYPPERMQIDLVRLCAAAGARLILDEVRGLDLARRELRFAGGRPPIGFDVLSVGVGSVPASDGVDLDQAMVVPVKPMQTFLERLDAVLGGTDATLPLRVVVVGGGAGGLEITFCLPAHVARLQPGRALSVALVDPGDASGGLSAGAAALARRELDARHVSVITGRRVTSVAGGRVLLDDGQALAADVVIWATHARPSPVLDFLGLPRGSDGFLVTDATLRVPVSPPVFAVGDCATITGDPLPKAGVYAVRQGPVLEENIDRVLAREDAELERYRPQRGFLKLVNTGDGRAILDYRRVPAHAAWCWRLKDRIDRRFVAMYQDYRPMPMRDAAVAAAAPAPPGAAAATTAPNAAMRCAGCGGKIAASVLAAALASLDRPPPPGDAAIIPAPAGGSLAVTVDFFAAPLDDPWLVGRIAALHALSDLHAVGAAPRAALAMVTLPLGPPRRQEALLRELLAGAVRELDAAGASLVGGHTIEGPVLTVGFTVLGEPGPEPRGKAGLREGDALVLTQPLGSGVLLAAHMQARCRASWMTTLLSSMLASTAPVAAILADHDVRGLTDVTGFGLAGHLLEMLRASRVGAELDLGLVPVLPGAGELLAAGVESTLAPANRAAEDEIEAAPAVHAMSRYRILFDPQTSGGLLAGVPERHVASFCARTGGTVIGRVLPEPPAARRLRVISAPPAR